MKSEKDPILKKLWKDPVAKAGLFLVGLVFLLASLGYAVTPDKTANANTMRLPIAGKSPGFSVDVLSIPLGAQKTEPWSWILFGKTASYEEIAVTDYKVEEGFLWYKKYKSEGFETPNWDKVSVDVMDWQQEEGASTSIKNKTFWLGTDRYGRDLLSRLLLGAKVSISVGFISIFISLLIGIPLGALAGYYKGKVDAVIMWLINVIWSIPTLLLVIALTLVLGKGFWQVFVAVGLTMWVEVARIVRGQVLSIREKEYIDAARVLGFSDFRIIWKHILPNALGPVIVISAANFASAILIESGLSFLGIGAQPPVASWGSIIRDHYGYIIMGKAYLALLPGLCIMVMVLSFMMIGNRLRDVLDVRENT